MNMTVVSEVLNNGPNKIAAGKKDALITEADFDAILQEYGKETVKDTNVNQNFNDINDILLQLLAFLSTGFLSDKKIAEMPVGNADSLQKNQSPEQIAARLLGNGDMNRLWEDIVNNFFAEGKLDEKMAVKFFKALKSCLPEIAKADIGSFLEQLKNLLEQKAEDFKTAGENKGFIATKSVEVEKTQNFDPAPVEKVKNYKMESEPSVKQDVKAIEQEAVRGKNQIMDRVSKTQNSYSEELLVQKSHENNSNISFQVLERYSGGISFESSFKSIDEKPETSQGIRLFSGKTLEQIVDKIQLALKDGTSELSLKLKPEHLGNVMVKIFSEGNKLRAELFIENAYIHEALQYHAQELKNQMQQHGYNLTEINIYQTSDWQGGTYNGREYEQNYESRYYRRVRYSPNDEEQSMEITQLRYYNGLENTVSVNYVV
ncbi:MAG TPA: flagellar hook-length control protein FliK [Thermoanaerobacterales bacterium]|nr:flagellar hook-length control protein FliK [Thermoanaerobacterales bacterium]